MTEGPTIQVAVDKQNLLEDIQALEGVVAEYGAFLIGSQGDAAWEADALALIKKQQILLSNAKVSLKTFDLVSAILREMVGRVEFQQLTLRLPGANGAKGGTGAKAPSAKPEAIEHFETLVAQVNRIAENAPLALQEKIRYLLLSSLNFFRAVVKDDKENADQVMTQINLLTSSRESQNLVREIALIAKDIYETLNALSEGIPVVDTLTETSNGISEAADKLKAVVQKLEEAAFGNLDFLEQLSSETRGDERLCTRLAGGLGKSRQAIEELKAAHPEIADALASVEQRLGEGMGVGVSLLQTRIQQNADTYMALTANQSFQDLTGQTLKKTIAFIENLEVELLEVLRKYKPVFDAASPVAAASAPKAPEQQPAPRKQSQEDVDALLAVLGF